MVELVEQAEFISPGRRIDSEFKDDVGAVGAAIARRLRLDALDDHPAAKRGLFVCERQGGILAVDHFIGAQPKALQIGQRIGGKAIGEWRISALHKRCQAAGDDCRIIRAGDDLGMGIIVVTVRIRLIFAMRRGAVGPTCIDVVFIDDGRDLGAGQSRAVIGEVDVAAKIDACCLDVRITVLVGRRDSETRLFASDASCSS